MTIRPTIRPPRFEDIAPKVIHLSYADRRVIFTMLAGSLIYGSDAPKEENDGHGGRSRVTDSDHVRALLIADIETVGKRVEQSNISSLAAAMADQGDKPARGNPI